MLGPVPPMSYISTLTPFVDATFTLRFSLFLESEAQSSWRRRFLQPINNRSRTTPNATATLRLTHCRLLISKKRKFTGNLSRFCRMKIATTAMRTAKLRNPHGTSLELLPCCWSFVDFSFMAHAPGVELFSGFLTDGSRGRPSKRSPMMFR